VRRPVSVTLAAIAGVLVAVGAALVVPHVGTSLAAAPLPRPSSPSPTVATPSAVASVTPQAAPSPQPTPEIPDGVFALGDSVMLGARAALREHGFHVDAKVSRQFGASVGIIRAAIERGTPPRDVVVHLGTNGTITMKDCRRLVTLVGPERRVFLVDVRVPRSWQFSDNDTLFRCDAAFAPDRVHVVDWYQYSKGRSSWFTPDRIHLQPPGQRAYAALLASAIRAVSPSATASPATSPTATPSLTTSTTPSLPAPTPSVSG